MRLTSSVFMMPDSVITSLSGEMRGNRSIVVCSDVVPDALELVQKYKEEEASDLYKFKKEDIPNMS